MPVTASDLRTAVVICRQTLGPVGDRDWAIPAHGLDWDCRETLDHVCDSIASYIANLAGRTTVRGEAAARDGYPRAGPVKLLRTVEIFADALIVIAAASPDDARAFHVWGRTDAEGFLAMGAAETLIHTWDIATAFGAPLALPDRVEALAGALLARLFPWAPAGVLALDALLACTGRGEVAGFDSVGPRWAWHSAPVAEWDGTIPLDPDPTS